MTDLLQLDVEFVCRLGSNYMELAFKWDNEVNFQVNGVYYNAAA